MGDDRVEDQGVAPLRGPGHSASPEPARAVSSADAASTPNAARDAAEAEAIKRERHKGKHYTHKRWAAVHTSTRGWHVALIDNLAHIQATELERARRAFRAGDMETLLDAASKALVARCGAMLEVPNPEES